LQKSIIVPERKMMKIFNRFILMIFLMFNCSNPLDAQWQQTNGLYSETIQCFAVNGQNIFAGTFANGVYLSIDNGASWTAVNSGLTNTNILALVVNGANIFAGSAQGVFRSTNNGTSWTAVNTGLTNIYVNALAVLNTNLFASTGQGVFLSTNNGSNWIAVNAGLTNNYTQTFAVSETSIFVGTGNAVMDKKSVFRSTNNGTNWINVSTGEVDCNALAFADTNLLASAGYGGVYRSTNNGSNWTKLDNILTNSFIKTFAVSGFKYFAGGANVYLSINGGENWTDVSAGLPAGVVNVLAVCGDNLFAGYRFYGVWKRPLSEMVTVVEKLPHDLAIQFNLKQNYPNPFNPLTTITFSLPSKCFSSLSIYDVVGRKVTTLISEEMSAGNYSFQWNATNYSAGLYYYRLQAGHFTDTKKLLLVK